MTREQFDKQRESLTYLTNIANAFDPVEGDVQFDPAAWTRIRNAIYDLSLSPSSTTRSMEGIAPQPKYIEHITFEGRDCVILSPEEYEALWSAAETIAPSATTLASIPPMPGVGFKNFVGDDKPYGVKECGCACMENCPDRLRCKTYPPLDVLPPFPSPTDIQREHKG